MAGSESFKAKVIFELDDKASGQLGKLEKGFAGIKKAALALGIGGAVYKGIQGLTRVLGEATQAAKEQEAAEVALGAALARQGPQAEAFTEALKAQAAELQKLGVAGDEAIIKTQALMASIGVGAGQLDEATEAAVNLSAAFGISLESAARNVGRTVGGFAGELGELIPELKNFSAEALQAGEGISFLNEQFKGQAAAQADTYAASMTRLTSALGDTQEVLGRELTDEGVVRSMHNLAFALERSNEAAAGSQLTSFFGTLKERTVGLAANFVAISQSMAEYVGWLEPASEGSKKLAKASSEATEALKAKRLEMDALKKSQEAAATAEDAFLESLRDLGVVLDQDVNTKLEEHEALLAEADAFYRAGVITRQDFEAAERAVAVAVAEATEAQEEQTVALGDLEGGYKLASQEAEFFGNTVLASSKQVQRATEIARTFNIEVGLRTGTRARSSGNQAAVDAALASGIAPTMGGTRIRTVDGGSVLLRT